MAHEYSQCPNKLQLENTAELHVKIQITLEIQKFSNINLLV